MLQWTVMELKGRFEYSRRKQACWETLWLHLLRVCVKQECYRCLHALAKKRCLVYCWSTCEDFTCILLLCGTKMMKSWHMLSKTNFINGIHVAWEENHEKDYVKEFGEIEKVKLAHIMPTTITWDFGFAIFDIHDSWTKTHSASFSIAPEPIRLDCVCLAW